MKTKKFLPIVMLILALASCSSKEEKKTTEVKEELPIVEVDRRRGSREADQ